MFKTIAAFAALTLLAGLAAAQTSGPSGLTTGSVTYTIPTTDPTKSYTFADNSQCGPAPLPVCPLLVSNLRAANYYNLVASDGTGTCYTMLNPQNYWAQFVLGGCQTSYHSNGSPTGSSALYCNGSQMWQNPVPLSDGDIFDVMNCVANFDGTIAPQTTPYPGNFNLTFEVAHHTVQIWVGPFYGRFPVPRHLEPRQQIDAGSQVVITPESGA